MSRQDKFKSSHIDDGSPEPEVVDKLQFDLRLKLDEVAALEAELLERRARRRPTETELGRLACRIYDARRARDRLLGDALFGEPGWDMLLALYCLPKRGKLMSVSSLCYDANTGTTTGLRWQKVLTEKGLIERGPCEVKPSRQIVRLTHRGRELLERYLTRLFYSDSPIPPSDGM